MKIWHNTFRQDGESIQVKEVTGWSVANRMAWARHERTLLAKNPGAFFRLSVEFEPTDGAFLENVPPWIAKLAAQIAQSGTQERIRNGAEMDHVGAQRFEAR